MAISDRITSIEEHIKESYQELEGIGIDTTGVNKNLENIPKLIDGYWETLPKVTGEGTSITLDNTKEGKMKIDLKGNTSQETTTGKNMYEGSQDFSGTWTNSYAWETDSNTYNGLIVKKRTSSWDGINKDLQVEAGKTYTFSCYIKCDTTRQVALYTSGGTATATPSSTNLNPTTSWQRYSITFVANENGTIRPRVENTSASDTNYTYICGYQLEENPSMTFYEPYTGNQPSPNPDYPQDIHVVSGDNSIDVCGKNILYYTNQTTSWGGAKINTNGNTITYTPNDSGQGGMGHTTYTQDIFIPAGSTLTYSQRYVSGSAWTSGSLTNSIILLKKDGTYLSKGFGDITTSNYQNTKKVIFTTEEDYIGIKCYSMMYAIAGMTTPLVYNVQLEYNSNITDFEPYQSASYPINLGDIELCKIGDYQDSIVKDNGKWYKHEIISKYIINSSNNFHLYDATNYPGRFYRDNFWTSSYPSNLGYMTHFKRETYTTGFGILSDGSFAIQTPNHRLWIINLSTPTLEEFNTWLSTNNVTFYRVLKTPTITEITDSTLISQLEALNGARSYTTQTNINQENNDNASILNASALSE